MPHSVARIKYFFVAWLLLPLTQPAGAQDNSTPSDAQNVGSRTDQSQGSAPLNPPGTGPETSSLDYLYNHKASDGSAMKEVMDANEQTKTETLSEDALGETQIQDPATKILFQKYLGSCEVSNDQVQA